MSNKLQSVAFIYDILIKNNNLMEKRILVHELGRLHNITLGNAEAFVEALVERKILKNVEVVNHPEIVLITFR